MHSVHSFMSLSCCVYLFFLFSQWNVFYLPFGTWMLQSSLFISRPLFLHFVFLPSFSLAISFFFRFLFIASWFLRMMYIAVCQIEIVFECGRKKNRNLCAVHRFSFEPDALRDDNIVQCFCVWFFGKYIGNAFQFHFLATPTPGAFPSRYAWLSSTITWNFRYLQFLGLYEEEKNYRNP